MIAWFFLVSEKALALLFSIYFIRVLLHDTIGIKKKSHHNFIKVVIIGQVTKKGRK